MARLATSAAHLYQRLQEFPHKLLVHSESDQSPFRRWTTGSGAGSSYRHHDPRNMYTKQISEGTAPLNGGTNPSCGGVARWSLGLEQLLADPSGASAFAHFLAKEFAAENINFWWACEQYGQSAEGTERARMAQEIWQRHLAEGASEPVNVDATAKRATALRLHLQPPPQDLFIQAQKQIFNVMKFDSYPRFLRSGVHAECARADLRGLPHPYAHNNRDDSSREDSSAKVKKSASNASERRRSGGASLLPWRLRTGSRDRAQDSDTPPQDTFDVVKSSQSGSGQCSLCRVVLPDGATSVVGVEPSITVERLIERLLQRRNLLCTAYDVLLKDAAPGEQRLVEARSPSVVLGGRCAVVERRCAVRVEVGGRCVAVRCRGARRLRHVLRPLAARYARHAHTRAMLDGRLLHPDTLMQELDGAKLQIVEVDENGEYKNVASEADLAERADDDAVSVTELPLRNDDCGDADTQSAASSSTSRSDCGSNGVNGVNGANGTNGVNGAGKVRAALRPGPPLHHHPPDFLENLRETQRQRLQSRMDAPPPRSPPPLPPKPPARPNHPTLPQTPHITPTLNPAARAAIV